MRMERTQTHTHLHTHTHTHTSHCAASAAQYRCLVHLMCTHAHEHFTRYCIYGTPPWPDAHETHITIPKYMHTHTHFTQCRICDTTPLHIKHTHIHTPHTALRLRPRMPLQLRLWGLLQPQQCSHAAHPARTPAEPAIPPPVPPPLQCVQCTLPLPLLGHQPPPPLGPYCMPGARVQVVSCLGRLLQARQGPF